MKGKKISCFLLSALFSVMSAIGQTNDESSSNQLKWLFQLTGSWKSKNATLQMGGKSYSFAYTADFKPVSDRNGLIMSENADIPQIGKLMGTNLIGVSPWDGKVHWFSVDNLGTSHEHIGGFTDRNHFSMTYHGMQNQKDCVETVSVAFDGPDTIHIKQTEILDGKTELVITGSFFRKKS